jgi:hypothetical protein
MSWKKTSPGLVKTSNQVANSYSLADQAKALTVQPAAMTTGNNPAYGDGQQFSPGQPLQPMHADNPPWITQYRVGRNLLITPRTEDPRLTPFQVLRTLADSHDIVSICIKMMIDQVTGDEHDIIPNKKEDKNDYTKDIDDVKAFLYKPDKVHLFNDWLKMYLNDVLPIDAGTIYKRRSRNGKLYSLDICDGSSFKPLIDAYGRVPMPPNAAYQQIIYGVPYGSANEIPGFSTNDIIYRPRYPRSWTPYGFAPTEQLLMKINIMLRRDDFHLRYYTKGALPDAGLFQVDAEWTPEQLDQYQQLWNDVMSGNIDERLSMRFVPKGTYTATKKFEYDPKVDEWIARLIAITFGVNPQAFIMMMNRATGEMQDSQQTDIGLGPLESFLEELFTDIIQNELGYPHLRFKYIDEKKEDAKTTVERNMQYVSRGLRSIDEIRAADGLAPATDLPDGVPPYVLLGNDIVFITKDFIEAKQKAQLDALKNGDFQAGNAQTAQIKPVVAAPKAQKSAGELKQFEKFALNRLKKKTKREFEPNSLNQELVKSINLKLNNMQQPEEVKQLFKNAELINDYSNKIADKFDELQEYMLDNADDMEEIPEDDKSKWLLLLLFGDYNFETSLSPTLEDMLTTYATKIFKQSVTEIKQIGEFTITADQQKAIIDKIVADRLAFLLPEIERVTREKVAANVSTADDETAVKQAITDSYAVSEDRATVIADVEYRTIQNTTRIATSEASEIVGGVLVSDGDYDGACEEANGQVWSLDYAERNVLQHINCIREFSFLSDEEVEAHGGFDEE